MPCKNKLQGIFFSLNYILHLKIKSENMKFDFNDIVLVPEIISNINSRSEVNPYDESGMLPIFTAPMNTVVDENNSAVFNDNKIYSILPRGIFKNTKSDNTVSLNNKKWLSYGLDEFKSVFFNVEHISPENNEDKIYALIDVANGHMKQVYDLCVKAKKIYGNKLVLMVGNIANPKTFLEYCKIGVDYVRAGIGAGNACLTTANVGVGYPMGSLISECYAIKKKNNFKTKIVADGGFKNFSDINKALIFADYVMLGSLFNKCYEAAGELYIPYMAGNYDLFTKEWWEKINLTGYKKKDIPNWVSGYLNKTLEEQKRFLIKKNNLHKKFRGMSTKTVQRDWDRKEIKTSEGIEKYNKIEYTLNGFVENLTDYLKSAMSYTNSRTLEDFKSSQYELITQNAFLRFNK